MKAAVVKTCALSAGKFANICLGPSPEVRALGREGVSLSPRYIHLNEIQDPFLAHKGSVFKLKAPKRLSLHPLLLSNNWKPVRSMPSIFFWKLKYFYLQSPTHSWKWRTAFYLQLQRGHKEVSDRRASLFNLKGNGCGNANKHNYFKSYG